MVSVAAWTPSLTCGHHGRGAGSYLVSLVSSTWPGLGTSHSPSVSRPEGRLVLLAAIMTYQAYNTGRARSLLGVEWSRRPGGAGSHPPRRAVLAQILLKMVRALPVCRCRGTSTNTRRGPRPRRRTGRRWRSCSHGTGPVSRPERSSRTRRPTHEATSCRPRGNGPGPGPAAWPAGVRSGHGQADHPGESLVPRPPWSMGSVETLCQLGGAVAPCRGCPWWVSTARPPNPATFTAPASPGKKPGALHQTTVGPFSSGRTSE